MDWKVLTAIVVVAAVGGWLIVRAIAPSTPRPISRQAVAERPPAIPAGRVTAVDRALPAVAGGTNNGAARSHDFDHDVAGLVTALNEDGQIQYFVFPNAARGATIPSTLRYQLAGRFWQGATTGVAR